MMHAVKQTPIPTHGHIRLKPPLSLSRGGGVDHASVLKKLKRLTDKCLYCGDAYQRRPATWPQARELTFDHIVPHAAGGPKTLENGLLACGTHNSARHGVPILNAIQGETGDYRYLTQDGTPVVEPQTTGTLLPQEIQARKRAFSAYLRFFVENRVRLTPQSPANSWFVNALDNLLFPFWGHGPMPQGRGAQLEAYRNRVKSLIETLHQGDPVFWKSATLKAIVETDFPGEMPRLDDGAPLPLPTPPERKSALLDALSALDSGAKTKHPDDTDRPHIVPGQNPFSRAV